MENEVEKIELSDMAALYKKQLFEIMKEWAAHTIDDVNGGYITDFGEEWKLISLRKNIWAQARQTYMFAAYYEYSGKQEKWLRLAKAGRDFLVTNAYAGDGRWNYEVSEDGKSIIEGTTTIFTDLFALIALSEYSYVSGDKTDLPLIQQTFERAEKNLKDPYFKDIKPHVWREEIDRHSPYMIAIHSSMVAEQVLGSNITRPFIKFCIDKLLNFFGANESGFLLESLKRDGHVWDTKEGRIVNPGHILEGMWFCIDYARKISDERIIEQALKIIRKTAEAAVDTEYGGVIHRFDCWNQQEDDMVETDTGALKADYKVDWVNCESLYAFALAAVLLKDKESIECFLKQHQFCQRYFRPAEGGDWYPVLDKNGTPVRKNKGGMHRVAFHVPRALMNISGLLETEIAF